MHISGHLQQYINFNFRDILCAKLSTQRNSPVVQTYASRFTSWSQLLSAAAVGWAGGRAVDVGQLRLGQPVEVHREPLSTSQAKSKLGNSGWGEGRSNLFQHFKQQKLVLLPLPIYYRNLSIFGRRIVLHIIRSGYLGSFCDSLQILLLAKIQNTETKRRNVPISETSNK